MERNFYDLPSWDDERMGSFDDEEDSADRWKPKPTYEACKNMYEQWRHVFFLLNSILTDINMDEMDEMDRMMVESQSEMMIGDAQLVAVKIRSSEVTGMYVSRMENAAIIRTHAQSIYSGLLILDADGIDESYIDVIRAEIDKFRELFKTWINSFEKDDFNDEWGLFV